ncbi:GNAT family N-acetyltransferase [Streptomyces chartreusis]|uniref:GNAT family N-acetyltransferase n=1 Tax=Streptomyces chartreusis TaxID=1969 RepID=UPI003673764B
MKAIKRNDALNWVASSDSATYPPKADELAEVTANFRQYLLGWDTAKRAEDGLDLFSSGITAMQFNGVVRVRSLEAVEQTVATARMRLAGIPWWWWVGPDSPKGTSAALTSQGAVLLAAMPLMVRPLDGDASSYGYNIEARGGSGALGEGPDGLSVEVVEGLGRLTELVDVYTKSMGIPADLAADVVRAEAAREDNTDVIRLAAVLDGRIVGTTVVITTHRTAGVFIVHVAEAQRRRGIGGALTAAALRVGRERGMRRAALIASPAGEALYRNFGFTVVSEYQLFAVPAV